MFRRAWKLTFAFLIIIFLFYSFLPTAFFRIVEPVARPLFKVREWGLGVSRFLPDTFSSKQTLIQKNAELTSRIQELELLIQNRELSKLGFASSVEPFTSVDVTPKVVARIISRPSQSPYDVLILDIGEQVVRVGDKVVGPGSVALGTITEVFGKSAKVLLYSSPGVETEAQQASTGAVVILKGIGGGNMTVSVPKGFAISTGDFFMIPGLQNRILSQVGGIAESDVNSFKEVSTSFPISIFTISWVEIHE